MTETAPKPRTTPEQARAARQRAKERPEADPALMAAYKEKRRVEKAKYRLRLLHDPVRQAEMRERANAPRRKANRAAPMTAAEVRAARRAVTKYRARLRKTPEGREHLREQDRRYQQAQADTPERRERRNAWARARRARMTPEERKRLNAPGSARKTNQRRARVQVSQADRLQALDKLIPRAIPRHVRDDILGDLTLAMLEGKCTADKVRSTINAARKKHNNPLWKEVSLDAPVPGMDGVAFIDMLEGGL